MAIETIEGAISGIKRTIDVVNAASGGISQGAYFSFFYEPGFPSPAVAPTPGIGGAALTSYAGQLPFDNPSSGNSYLAYIRAMAVNPGTLLLCDRLWHNSGIAITSTSEQTFTSSAQIPSRDMNGLNLGHGVFAGVEVSSATGAGTPTLTLKYDNQDGVEKTATNLTATAASSARGRFYPIGLAAGDTGIQRAKSLTLSTSWTSGTIHVVLYRVIARVELEQGNQQYTYDGFSLGFPRMYDNTVPFLVYLPGGSRSSGLSVSYSYAQG